MTRAPGSSPFADWLGPAPRPPLWHLPAGLGLVFAVWAGWTSLLLRLAGAEGWPLDSAVDPVGIAFLLASLAGLWPAVWAALRLLERARLAPLLAAPGTAPVRWFARGLALGLATAAASALLATAVAGPPARTAMAPGAWLLWALPIALLTLAQASGEELLFRGWLTRLLARRWRRPVVWAGLPSLAFAALHYQPGPEGALIVAGAGLFGLAAAVLLWRSGTLAPAMGLHAGINLPGLVLVGLEGPLSGALLWSWDADAALAVTACGAGAAFALFTAVLTPALGRADRRR